MSPTAAGRDLLAAWLKRTIAWPDMRHHMMMRLFLGHLMPAGDLSALLADYRDRTAGWSARLREIEAKFAPRWLVPTVTRCSSSCSACATSSPSRTSRWRRPAAPATRSARRATARGPEDGELAGRLLDIIREYREERGA